MADAFVGDVAERAVFPSVGYRKKYRAIAANENIFLGFALGTGLRRGLVSLRRVVLLRIVIARTAWILPGVRFAVVRLLPFGCGCFICVVGEKRRVVAAAKKREIRSDELAIAVSIAVARVCAREVGVIEAQAWDSNVLGKNSSCGAGASHGSCGRAWRAGDYGARTGANVMAASVGVTCRGGMGRRGRRRVRDRMGRWSGKGRMGTHHSTASALCLADRGKNRERNNGNQEAAHGEYLIPGPPGLSCTYIGKDAPIGALVSRGRK